MIERFHRHLKSSIKCNHQTDRWTEVLPLILLGIRAALKEDLGCTTAEMVYGSTLRLPGEFFIPATDHHSDPADFVSRLRDVMTDLRAPPVRPQQRATYISKALHSCSHVFVRRDAVKKPLQPPYDGPYKVLQKTEKFYLLEMRGKSDTVSIDRLKPAFMEATPPVATTSPPKQSTLLPKESMPPTHPPLPPTPSIKPPATPATTISPKPTAPLTRMTRAGRTVKWPDKLNL